MKYTLLFCVLFLQLQVLQAQTGIPQPHEPCGPNEEVFRYLEFSLDHSADHKQPHWVAYTLESEELNYSRAFDYSPFDEDPHLTVQGATRDDYRSSGYDRGHLTRSSYNKRTDQTLRESFYLSGISPQIGVQFNRVRGAWFRIEEVEVDLANRYGKVYGVSGPVFQDNIGVIGTNGVTIPGHFYKVILYHDDNEQWQAAGLLTPHAVDSQTPVEEFIRPIVEIENLSGIDFNCFLPDSSQHRLEMYKWSNLN